jgi:hypothetical protein
MPQAGARAVGAGKEETEVIKPTTSDNHTQRHPFAINNAGPGKGSSGVLEKRGSKSRH